MSTRTATTALTATPITRTATTTQTVTRITRTATTAQTAVIILTVATPPTGVPAADQGAPGVGLVAAEAADTVDMNQRAPSAKSVVKLLKKIIAL